MLNSVLTRFAAGAACTPGSGGFDFIPTWYKYLEGETVNGKCSPVIDLKDHPEQIARILMAIFEILLRLGGMVAFAFIIYGGFQYLTAQGEPDKAKSARTTIINAIVGLVLTLMATVIVNLVAGTV